MCTRETSRSPGVTAPQYRGPYGCEHVRAENDVWTDVLDGSSAAGLGPGSRRRPGLRSVETEPGAAPGRGHRVELDGLTLAVVGGRKTNELAMMLEEHGAEVIAVEGVNIGPVSEVDDLTEAVCARPPSVAVLTTDAGLSLWLDAADAAGRRDELLEALRGAELIVRGPKVAGAAAAAGLQPAWCGNGSMRELVEKMEELPYDHRGVLVQLPPGGAPEITTRLIDRGVRALVAVPYTHTAGSPEDLRHAVLAALRGALDAIVVTNRPAAQAILGAAGTEDQRFLACAKAGMFTLFCLGQAARRVLADADPLLPPEPRLGALARLVTDVLPGRNDVRLGGLSMRGRVVSAGRRRVQLTPREAALLRVLSTSRGRVVTRHQLESLLSGGVIGSSRSLEVSIARLRKALGAAAAAIVTVPRRGYMLDPTRWRGPH